MHCRNCGNDNPADAKFCTNCGSAMELACPNCAEAANPGDKFCGNCGHQLPWADLPASPVAAVSGTPAKAAPADTPGEPEAERREVTVLFSDLSGFTHWSSTLDPEETHAFLNRYFTSADEIVRSFGGRVDKHIGDAVMAVFGAPVSHGNDAERAVRAALEIHTALEVFDPPLTAHIGIANGTVVASRTGSDTHREYTVTGNSVNLAARLQDLAKPGETLTSASVRDGTARHFEWEQRGETRIKGLDALVPVWRVASIARSGPELQRPGFIGRANELAQFSVALSTCREAGAGGTIRVRGEPGIGKSRLVEEFRGLALDGGFQCHTSQVFDFGTGRGDDAIASLLSSLLKVDTTAGTGARAAAAYQAATDGLIDETQLIFLYDLLDVPQPPDMRSLYDAMAQEDRTAGKETTLSRVIESISRKSPLVITAEDVHWADEPTLSHLGRLAELTAEAPLLLILTTRIEGDPMGAQWRGAARGARLTTIDLAPLTQSEALSLAANEFDVAENLIRSCVQRASGNPFFLEQLLRNANETNAEVLPGSVQSIVQSRIDKLDMGDRRALQAASVLGQRFSPEAVKHLLGDTGYHCGSLVGHFLIRPVGADFLFAHALVRDGVYSSLIKSRREELHQLAADWFAGRDLTLRAEHLARAHDKRATAAFTAAARGEMAAYHVDRALALIEQGLEEPHGEDRHELACLHGDVLRGLGSVEQSIEAFEETLSLAESDTEKCEALLGLAEGMRVSGRLEEAMSRADQAQSIVGTDRSLLSAEIHHLRGNLYFPTGDLESCMREHEAALNDARAAGSQEWEARALGGLGDASYLAGRMKTSCDHFKRCVSLSKELGLGRTEVANRHMVGWTRVYLNEFAEARADGEAAVDLAVKAGQTRAELLSHQLLAQVHIYLGDYDAAINHADVSIDLGQRLDNGNFIAQGRCQRSQALLLADQPDKARQASAEALHIVRKVGMSFVGPTVLTACGLLAEDDDQRRALFAEADEILRHGCVSHNYFWCYQLRIEKAVDRQDWQTSDQFADRLEQFSAGEPLPWSDFFIDLARALARAGRGESGADLTLVLQSLQDRAASAGIVRPLPLLAAALESRQASAS